MKILFIGKYVQTEKLSGPEKVAKRIFCRISGRIPSEFWEYYFDGSEYNYFRKFFGSEIIDDPSARIFKKGIFSAVYSLFRLRPDVVHIITFERYAAVFILLKWLFKYKICYNIHGIITYERELKGLKKYSFLTIKDRVTESLLFRFSDQLLFLSSKSVEMSLKYYKINPSKIIIVKNGIDEVFYYRRGNKKVEIDRLRILFIGDFARIEKGLQFFINTFRQVSFPVTLTIIGQCPEIKNVNPNLEISVLQKSETDAFAAICKDNDVYVSASSFDTFPVSSIEAMAAGVIPVLTRETGSFAIIEQYKNGAVYNYGDSETLLEFTSRLYKDPLLRSELSRRSSEVFQIYNWDIVVEDYLLMYNKLAVL